MITILISQLCLHLDHETWTSLIEDDRHSYHAILYSSDSLKSLKNKGSHD